MQLSLVYSTSLLVAIVYLVSADEEEDKKPKELQIEVMKSIAPELCSLKSSKGDKMHVHYTGFLEDGSVFDSSITRGHSFGFTMGMGKVIKGWEQGLTGMCKGEKRKLVIPSHLAYGDRGAGGKIAGGATLTFEVELLNIDRKKDEL